MKFEFLFALVRDAIPRRQSVVQCDIRYAHHRIVYVSELLAADGTLRICDSSETSVASLRCHNHVLIVVQGSGICYFLQAKESREGRLRKMIQLVACRNRKSPFRWILEGNESEWVGARRS